MILILIFYLGMLKLAEFPDIQNAIFKSNDSAWNGTDGTVKTQSKRMSKENGKSWKNSKKVEFLNQTKVFHILK